MSLPMMAAALAATTLGVALLTAPTQAQDPNASAVTAPKAARGGAFGMCSGGRRGTPKRAVPMVRAARPTISSTSGISARLPSGTLVEVLCGQPEQKYGVR